MLDLMADHLQVLQERCRNLRVGPALSSCPSCPHPSNHQLHKKEMARPFLSLPVSSCHVLTSACLSPFSPCLSACWAFHVAVAVSAFLCLCYLSVLPILSPAGHSARQHSHCLPGSSGICHAVPLLPSVCPRPAADTAFNSLCSSPFNFLVVGRGQGRHRQGGAPSNPVQTLLG